MVTRIAVDLSQDEMIAKLWNSSAGRAAIALEMTPNQVAVLVCVRLSDFPTETERGALASALLQASPKVETAELLSEVRVPQTLSSRAWRLHIGSHLRADRTITTV